MRDKQLGPARAKLEACVKAAPKNADCHRLLGTVFAKQGELEKGAKEYREFLKLAPADHPEYERVKKILDEYQQAR
jgi:Tfp pilus assembly protein PilF